MQKAIYLFYGEEDFLIDEKINALKGRIDNPALNFEIIEFDDSAPEKLINALQTQPLLLGDKLLLVRRFKVSAENQEGYIQSIRNISPSVNVIFQAAAIDQRSKFFRFIKETGEAVEFKPFAPWESDQLMLWIQARASQEGKKISDGAAKLLIEICGMNLRILATDLEKIATFTGERNEILESDILALASSGQKNVFDLQAALREKDLRKTLEVFQNLLRNKADFFQLLGSLASQYRLLLQIKSLGGGVRDPRRVAEIVKGHPFYVRKCLEKIDNFSILELQKAMENILDTSLKMKTGQSQTVIFELLLASLCGR